MNRIIHTLVGYDRATERLAAEFDVPEAVLDRAKRLAGVTANDPDATMCYPLDASCARDLAGILGVGVDTERRDYFLESAED